MILLLRVFQRCNTQTMIFIIETSITVFISQIFLYDSVEGSYSLILFENSNWINKAQMVIYLIDEFPHISILL